MDDSGDIHCIQTVLLPSQVIHMIGKGVPEERRLASLALVALGIVPYDVSPSFGLGE